jgi:hypothetical protein
MEFISAIIYSYVAHEGAAASGGHVHAHARREDTEWSTRQHCGGAGPGSPTWAPSVGFETSAGPAWQRARRGCGGPRALPSTHTRAPTLQIASTCRRGSGYCWQRSSERRPGSRATAQLRLPVQRTMPCAFSHALVGH